MAENELFRKTSLERVSSPEQLNEYIKITNPSLIAILVAIFAILSACGFWIFSGNIPKYVELNGVAVTKNVGEQDIYCYVPITTAKRLQEGMNVQISTEYAPREEYGFRNGTIKNVGEEIISLDYIEENFENPNIVVPVLPNGNYVEVVISQGDWSSEKGESVEISDGSVCSLSVVVGEQKPYKLIFNF